MSQYTRNPEAYILGKLYTNYGEEIRTFPKVLSWLQFCINDFVTSEAFNSIFSPAKYTRSVDGLALELEFERKVNDLHMAISWNNFGQGFNMPEV
jgi:hypothetical protein